MHSTPYFVVFSPAHKHLLLFLHVSHKRLSIQTGPIMEDWFDVTRDIVETLMRILALM
tara:strand:+ start:6366 stop:6539 length:174 start_codon:yes stop_codon:yes gene_type:complete